MIHADFITNCPYHPGEFDGLVVVKEKDADVGKGPFKEYMELMPYFLLERALT